MKQKNRKETEQKKIGERTHLAVAQQAGLGAAQPANGVSPTHHTDSVFFFLRQEAARWRAARRSIHRRHSDAPDEGHRPPTAIKTFPAAMETLEPHPFPHLELFSLRPRNPSFGRVSRRR
jgi:hypothetical protein